MLLDTVAEDEEDGVVELIDGVNAADGVQFANDARGLARSNNATVAPDGKMYPVRIIPGLDARRPDDMGEAEILWGRLSPCRIRS